MYPGLLNGRFDLRRDVDEADTVGDVEREIFGVGFHAGMILELEFLVPVFENMRN